MIISHEIKINPLDNIKEKIINPLKNDNVEVDIATCTSGENNIISSHAKYNFKFNNLQLSKTCYVVTKVNDEYEYYIKYRPEIVLDTIIDKKFLTGLSKTKINCRCRSYIGPPINLKFGLSIPSHVIKPTRTAICLGDETVINPDDQMYIFHKSIKKAFAPIINGNYSDNMKNNLDKLPWKKSKMQGESHHGYIWKKRGFGINPIGLNINMKGLYSSDLIVNSK